MSTAPSWSKIKDINQSKFRVQASPARASGRPTNAFDLWISDNDGQITVQEEARCRKLPVFCPQRHINTDSSFCLGLHAGLEIDTLEAASLWWEKLKSFLICQETATETGLWPIYAQMSHGTAGEIEAQAEALADRLGCFADYQQATQYDSGPIAEALAHINKTTGRLYNGRALCLCSHETSTGRTILRRACSKSGCLVEIEYRRRFELDRFWLSITNQTCCKSMRNCALQNSSS